MREAARRRRNGESRPAAAGIDIQAAGDLREEAVMFKKCFYEPAGNLRIKSVALPLSFLIHALAVLCLIVIPLIETGTMPSIAERLNVVWVPPPPPPLPPARHGGRKTLNTLIQRVAKFIPVKPGHLVAPLAIPREISDEEIAGFGIDGGVGDGIDGGTETGSFQGVVGPIIKKNVGEDETPIVCGFELRPPRLVKQVPPVYPEIARLTRVGGLVVIQAETDTQGRVVRWKVLRSHPLLEQAAVEAVRQWIYEPMVVNGRPRGVIFTVTIKFELR